MLIVDLRRLWGFVHYFCAHGFISAIRSVSLEKAIILVYPICNLLYSVVCDGEYVKL